MKKIKYCFILVILTLWMSVLPEITVSALSFNVYNGKDVPASGGSGSCADGQAYNHFCRYSKHPGTRISVIYYNGSSYETIGQSIDIYPSESTFFSSAIRHNNQTSNNKVSITNPAPAQTAAGTYPVNSSYFNLDYFTPASNGGYKYIVLNGMPVSGSGEEKYWEKVFLKDSMKDGEIDLGSIANQIIELCTQHSLSKTEMKTFWTKKTEEADPNGGGINKIGYRVLVEPIYVYKGKEGNFYVMTPTEYASLVWNTGSYTTLSQVSYYVRIPERMVTKFDDIGIYSTASCGSLGGCTATDVQFNSKKGHALSIVDISKLFEKKECDINDPTFSEECCEELMAEYPALPKSFWIGKGCLQPDPPTGCTWVDYEVNGLEELAEGDCTGSTSLEANDTKKWDCIYESDNIPTGTKLSVFRDYYLQYSNPYCAVYCREDVKYNFPSAGMTVKAGYHFTVNSGQASVPNWSPIQFTSTRECVTHGSTRDDASTQINTAKFQNDWINANERVIATWDAWQIAILQEQSYARQTRSDVPCDPYCPAAMVPVKNQQGYVVGYVCPVAYKYRGVMMYPGQPNANGYGVGAQAPYCSSQGHPDPGAAAKQIAHQNAKDYMDTVEDDISACTSWNNFDNYRHASFNHTNIKATRYSKYFSYTELVNYEEFSPDITIDYEDPMMYYSYSDLLSKNQNVSSSTTFSTSGAIMNGKYLCNRSYYPCYRTQRFYYSPKPKVEATYTKKVGYTLQDGVYNVILKPQGTAIFGSEAGSDREQIYIPLGYSALHTHYMTPTGSYYIGLSYPAFTPADNRSSFEHNFDQFIEEEPIYECTYNVDNEIMEEDPAPLGLDLIYRPIDLSTPFPGVDGDGRTPGKNWNVTGYVQKYITRNRNTNTDRIYYDKYPMYQITLTPALIQEIREYNETTNYNDFNMDCLSNGRECKSNFIRTRLNGGYNFSNRFTTCSIAGNRGTTTCCGIGNWNDCDRQDGIVR